MRPISKKRWAKEYNEVIGKERRKPYVVKRQEVVSALISGDEEKCPKCRLDIECPDGFRENRELLVVGTGPWDEEDPMGNLEVMCDGCYQALSKMRHYDRVEAWRGASRGYSRPRGVRGW